MTQLKLTEDVRRVWKWYKNHFAELSKEDKANVLYIQKLLSRRK